MVKKNTRTTKAFEKSLAQPGEGERYVLRLYVTGMTPRSTEAFAAIRTICEEHLRGRYDLEVIDIYQHPALAKDEQIIAVPTLVKELPAPLRRLIGNLSAEDRVLLGLDLRRTTGESQPLNRTR
jgi:circadian clock protein KaiB